MAGISCAPLGIAGACGCAGSVVATGNSCGCSSCMRGSGTTYTACGCSRGLAAPAAFCCSHQVLVVSDKDLLCWL